MKHADLTTLTATFPLVQDLIALKETTGLTRQPPPRGGLPYVGLTADDVQDAHARLQRFAPYLAAAFRNRRERRDYRIRSGCHSGNETQP